MIGDVHDPLADRDFFVDAAPAAETVDLHVALLRTQRARNDREQGGLSHAVGAEDRDDLPGFNAQTNVAQHRTHTVMLRDIHDVDHGPGSGWDTPVYLTQRRRWRTGSQVFTPRTEKTEDIHDRAARSCILRVSEGR